MLKIDYDQDEDIFLISFKGIYFDFYYNVCKNEFLKWNSDLKLWKSDTRSPVRRLLEVATAKKENDIQLNFNQSILESEKAKPTDVVYFRDVFDFSLMRLPPLLGKHPYELYQTDEIKKGIAKNRHGFLLPMGLGKTYIMAAVLSHFFTKGRIDRCLIVCPTNALINIKKELAKFSNVISEDDCLIVTIENKEEAFQTEHKILIMAYHIFVNISDAAYKEKNGVLKKYLKAPLDLSNWGTSRCLFYDEAHYIKCHSSSRSRVLLMHKHFFGFRYPLTGTPITKYFDDIWPQFKMLDESLVPKDYHSFLKDVANIGNRFSPYAINYIKKDRQEHYEKLYGHLISKYNADDVLDLPELIIKKNYIALNKQQEDIYRNLVEYEIAKLVEEDGEIVPKKLQMKFPFLSLALEYPKLLLKHTFDDEGLNEKILKFKNIKMHSKYEVCAELVEEYIADGKKVVVFDTHPIVLDDLAEQFKKYNPIVLHGEIKNPKGKTTSEHREEMLDLFKTSDKHNLLIAQETLLSVAVNLQCSSRVIHFNRNWNIADYIQVNKRFHRPGQKDRVVIHVLLVDNSIDLIKDANLEGKQSVIDNVFKQKSLTNSELKNILNGRL